MTLYQGNSFQAVLLTDGAKSYAVFTYNCGDLDWSNAATIGFNTPADYRFNHPVSGTDFVDEIACLHVESDLNNLIYDLEISPVILPITPPPTIFLGTCILTQLIHDLVSKPRMSLCSQGVAQLLDTQIAVLTSPLGAGERQSLTVSVTVSVCSSETVALIFTQFATVNHKAIIDHHT